MLENILQRNKIFQATVLLTIVRMLSSLFMFCTVYLQQELEAAHKQLKAGAGICVDNILLLPRVCICSNL